jgi:NADH dehydrogenase
MPIHTLDATQLIPRPFEDVFSFFANPENLARITPPWMAFKIVSKDREMRTGLKIAYTLHAFPGVPTAWWSAIAEYDPPRAFTDVQIDGPYRRWQHRHRFTQVDDGTLVDDQIAFELPFGRLGGVAAGLVKSQLREIFTYRARAVEEIFEPAGISAPGLAPRVVAVAGGTGFVGSAIARELRRRGHVVVVLSSHGNASRGSLPDDVAIRRVDVTTGRGLPDALEGVDALVVALAFRNSPIEQPRHGQTFAAVDAKGTERLVAAARSRRLDAILYVSGAGAAPDADRHWFRAKWRAEQAIRSSGLRWTILRPTWIYGPRDVSLNRFVGLARRLPAVPLTNRGRQRLAPVFVDDVAAAAADLLVKPVGAEAVFEIGGPEVLEMREIVRRAAHHAGLDRPIVPGPAPLLKIGAAPLTLLPNPPLTPDAIDFINQPAVVDSAPLRAALGREMRRLDEALATYLGRLPNGATLAID